MLEWVQNISEVFFQKLWVSFSSLEVKQEWAHIFRVHIESDDSNILIWPHGKNLEILTHILKLLISKKTGTHIHIHLEINDYLEKKDQKLLDFIQMKIDTLKNSESEVILPYFSAYERKKVHTYVSNLNNGVYTQSYGEGENRRMHLRKKDVHLTIDVDGDDI